MKEGEEKRRAPIVVTDSSPEDPPMGLLVWSHPRRSIDVYWDSRGKADQVDRVCVVVGAEDEKRVCWVWIRRSEFGELMSALEFT